MSKASKEYLNENYVWQDIKSDGNKNIRAKKKRKLTDEEYLEKVSKLRTSNWYAQK